MPMTRDEQLALLRSIVGRLNDAATDARSMNNAAYREERDRALADTVLASAMPVWIRNYGDLDHFRSYALTLDGYRARRDFVSEAFARAFGAVERDSPAADQQSDALRGLSSAEVDRVWRLALERRESDPEGAITLARTLLETVAKNILDDLGVTYAPDEDLPALYRMVAERLNLAASQQSAETLRSVFGSVSNVVGRLAEFRNRHGDSHGHGREAVEIDPRHAALAVNLAGSVAAFIVETWTSRRG